MTQSNTLLVFSGEKDFNTRRDRPTNRYIGIVPCKTSFGSGVIVVAAFVNEVGRLAQDQKAVRKASRHPQLAAVFRRELLAHPLPECRRAPPQVDGNVEDASERAPDQFSLRPVQLVMQAAKRSAAGPAMVVLNELRGDSRIGKFRGLPCFHEESTLIAEHRGFYANDIRDTGRCEFHAGPGSDSTFSRYSP